MENAMTKSKQYDAGAAISIGDGMIREPHGVRYCRSLTFPVPGADPESRKRHWDAMKDGRKGWVLREVTSSINMNPESDSFMEWQSQFETLPAQDGRRSKHMSFQQAATWLERQEKGLTTAGIMPLDQPEDLDGRYWSQVAAGLNMAFNIHSGPTPVVVPGIPAQDGMYRNDDLQQEWVKAKSMITEGGLLRFDLNTLLPGGPQALTGERGAMVSMKAIVEALGRIQDCFAGWAATSKGAWGDSMQQKLVKAVATQGQNDVLAFLDDDAFLQAQEDFSQRTKLPKIALRNDAVLMRAKEIAAASASDSEMPDDHRQAFTAIANMIGQMTETPVRKFMNALDTIEQACNQLEETGVNVLELRRLASTVHLRYDVLNIRALQTLAEKSGGQSALAISDAAGQYIDKAEESFRLLNGEDSARQAAFVESLGRAGSDLQFNCIAEAYAVLKSATDLSALPMPAEPWDKPTIH